MSVCSTFREPRPDGRPPVASVLAAGLVVTLLMPVPSPAASGLQKRPSPDAPVEEKLVDAVVAEAMAREHLPGVAVAIVRDGRIVLLKGYGSADVAKKRPVDPRSTIFRIGSITKVFTMLALAQLAERKGIGLDEDVNRHLRAVTVDGRYPEPVRLRHLLTHTGGFDQIGPGRHAEDSSSRISLEEFLRRDLVRVRPPGQVSCYDTYGVTLAGYLVESISKLSYPEYSRRHLFGPLGMESTFVEVPKARRDDLAVGYGFADGGYVPQRYEYYVTTPASSIDSTAEDMGRFMLALLDDAREGRGSVFGKSVIEGLRSPQFSNAPGFPAFTYGFWEEVRNGQRAIHHGGTMLGFTSELYLVPAHDRGLFVIYNRDAEAGGGPARLRETLVERLMDLWFPERAAGPIAPTRPLEVDTDRFAGNYADNLYCHTCLEGEGWRMFFTPVRAVSKGVVDVAGSRFVAVEPLVFESVDNGRRIAFRESSQGEITHLISSRNSVLERLGDRLLDELLGKGWRERPPAPLVPLVYRANEEWAKAATAFASLAERNPKNGRAQYNEGHAWLKAGEMARAIPALLRAWKLEESPDWTAYRLATAYALRDEREQALDWLERAVDAGFGEKDMLEEDPNLKSLRDDVRFKAIANRVK